MQCGSMRSFHRTHRYLAQLGNNVSSEQPPIPCRSRCLALHIHILDQAPVPQFFHRMFAIGRCILRQWFLSGLDPVNDSGRKLARLIRRDFAMPAQGAVRRSRFPQHDFAFDVAQFVLAEEDLVVDEKSGCAEAAAFY